MSEKLRFELIDLKRAGELHKAGEEAKAALLEGPEPEKKAVDAMDEILTILKPTNKDEAVEEIQRIADEFGLCVTMAADRKAMEMVLDMMFIGMKVSQSRRGEFELPLRM